MNAEHWVDQAATVVRKPRYVLRTGAKSAALLPSTATGLNALLDSAEPEHILKDDRTTTVVKLSVSEKTFILKRYNPRNQWHKLKRALRKSRARRCWEMSFEFKRSGLNVSPPVMMFEDRYALIRMNAYFVNKFLAGDELLTALPNMPDSERELVKQAVMQAFKKLEESRISHGDMKATNLLWVNGELFFIDLDAAQKHSKWSLTWSKSHLKDKRRFMKNWQGQPELLALFPGLEC